MRGEGGSGLRGDRDSLCGGEGGKRVGEDCLGGDGILSWGSGGRHRGDFCLGRTEETTCLSGKEMTVLFSLVVGTAALCGDSCTLEEGASLRGDSGCFCREESVL